MAIEPSEVANSLSEKYQALHQAFTDLAIDAAHFHNAIQVQDTTTRNLFTALSRILAFSDHVHVALNLMGEDVRALEAAHGDLDDTDWSEKLEDCFEEWFLTTPVASSKVH
jgi:hypothetical protein